MSLATELSKFKENVHTSMQKEHSRVILEANDNFVRAWNPANALSVGDRFPDFTLSDATGSQVSLEGLLARGPLLISFYRGEWCPYCNLALKALQDSLAAIQAKGVTLVAISPELPNQSLSTQEKHDLKFPVLSDVGNTLARRLGIVFKQSDRLRFTLEAFDVDLQARNGDDSYEAPLPASYLVDGQGIIRNAFLDPDYTHRLEPATALEWIDQLETE